MRKGPKFKQKKSQRRSARSEHSRSRKSRRSSQGVFVALHQVTLHTLCVLPQCSLQACHARAQTAHGPRFIPRYLLSGSPTIDITYDGSWTGITQGLNGNKEHMQGLIANRRVRHPGVDSSGVRFILVHLNTHINCINTLQCSVPTK